MKRIMTLAIVLLGIVAFSVPANALPVNLSNVFSGTINAAGPYAQVTLTQVTNGVQFDVTNLTAGNLEGGSSKLFEFSFNYKGSATLTHPTDPTGWVINGYTSDAYKADGDGSFDFLVAGIGETFLGTGNTLTFTIAGDTNVNNFIDDSVGGDKGAFKFAAHIGSLANPAGGSAWVGDGTGVTLPEPGTMILLGLGLLGLGIVVRKRS
jgi:hypothetical protein